LPKKSAGLVLVHVRWFDASYQRGECSPTELCPLIELESAGLLAAEDERTISIALDWCASEGVWRYIQHIPKVNVRRVKRYKV